MIYYYSIYYFYIASSSNSTWLLIISNNLTPSTNAYKPSIILQSPGSKKNDTFQYLISKFEFLFK